MSLLFLLLSYSDFVSQIMLSYFSLSSNSVCTFYLLHVIYLLVSSDSTSFISLPHCSLCPLSHMYNFLFSLFLHISWCLLYKKPHITPWVFLWSLLLYHRIFYHDNPRDMPPTALPLCSTPRRCRRRLLSPAKSIKALLSKPPAVKKWKSRLFLQILWLVPSVKGLLFTWCAW